MIDIISIALSIVSLIVGIVSIVLSIKFYKEASDLSLKSTEALAKIENSTKRLEDLYDNYVKEIFAMHKIDHNKASDAAFNQGHSAGSEGSFKNKEEEK